VADCKRCRACPAFWDADNVELNAEPVDVHRATLFLI